MNDKTKFTIVPCIDNCVLAIPYLNDAGDGVYFDMIPIVGWKIAYNENESESDNSYATPITANMSDSIHDCSIYYPEDETWYSLNGDTDGVGFASMTKMAFEMLMIIKKFHEERNEANV